METKIRRKIDMEYSTQDLKELDVLADAGIRYVFVKTIENDVRVYKYIKTEKLFNVLAEFYKNK